jgi:alpha-D-xyloside xylohydrolase
VYPGADGAFTLYDDDGVSFAYWNGDWTGIRMEWMDAARRLTLRLAEGSRLRPPGRVVLEVRVAPDRATRQVVFEGAPLELRL